jgi:hypothetical protein
MAVTITCRTSDAVDDPIVAHTAVHVEVHGLDPYDHDEDGVAVQNVYRIFADGPQAARDDGWSHAFTPSAEGDHEWDGHIFPEAGEVTFRVFKLDTDGAPDTEVGTQAVTVVEEE